MPPSPSTAAADAAAALAGSLPTPTPLQAAELFPFVLAAVLVGSIVVLLSTLREEDVGEPSAGPRVENCPGCGTPVDASGGHCEDCQQPAPRRK